MKTGKVLIGIGVAGVAIALIAYAFKKSGSAQKSKIEKPVKRQVNPVKNLKSLQPTVETPMVAQNNGSPMSGPNL